MTEKKNNNPVNFCLTFNNQDNICAPTFEELNEKIIAYANQCPNEESAYYCKVILILCGKCNDFIYKNNDFINYKKRKKIEGIMLHSPAVETANAKKLIKNAFNIKRNGSTNAVIDADTGELHQCMPWQWQANHCAGTFNRTHIGIDICDPSSIRYVKYYTNKDGVVVFPKGVKDTYKEAKKNNSSDELSTMIFKMQKLSIDNINKKFVLEKVDILGKNIKEKRQVLFEDIDAVRQSIDIAFYATVDVCAKLCIMYNLDPLKKGPTKIPEKLKKSITNEEYYNVIISHEEGYRYFDNASNHSDPTMLWRNFKKALNPESELYLNYPYTMDNFRFMVAKKINEFKNSQTSTTIGIPELNNLKIIK